MSSSLLEAVQELAKLTGDVAMRHYRTALTVETKHDGSPVTAADHQAEEAARAWLAKRFPEDGITGEEFGERSGTSGRRWLLDPVDGTKSFIRGVPMWGSLVAVQDPAPRTIRRSARVLPPRRATDVSGTSAART